MIRELVNLAVTEGRRRQSKQTGFVHYCYYADESEHHDTIPTYENLLFVLALLRSRIGDNITEAKRMLEKVLSYQNKVGGHSPGNFPICLHEYPFCFDRWHGVQLLAPLYWIHHHFHSILGRKLAAQVRNAAEENIKHCLLTLKENSADYLTTLNIATAAKALGKDLDLPDIEKEGEELLAILSGMGSQPVWFSSQGLSRMIASLQLVYPTICKSPWQEFWEHLERMWHVPTQSYCGPAFDEWSQGAEPMPTLYDLYMGHLSGSLSKRCSLPHHCHLEAALIQFTEDHIRAVSFPRTLQEEVGTQKCQTYFAKTYAYSSIEQNGKIDPQSLKGFHPFRLVWGDLAQMHTLVCQGGNIKAMNAIAGKDQVEFIFDLGEPKEKDKFVENREVVFYCSKGDGLKLTVDGARATTFRLGEKVQLKSSIDMNLTFELIEGEGNFLGHLMPGNRLSQQDRSTEAQDWQIFLRNIERTPCCRVRVTLQIQPQNVV
ncbi:MAG: hypothetical protein K940chlam7_00193 [Chlamydiae bacterium]|nr:hypothetical protein [Chlamydiota bacterium]